MAFDWVDLSVEERQRVFLDLTEHVDEYIAVQELNRNSPWLALTPVGPYQLGEGLVKQAHSFFPGLPDQRGLQTWRPLVISSPAANGNPAVDACDMNPYVVKHGFRTVEYSGFTTERMTKPFCIKDIRFMWQFEQQVTLIMSFLGDTTLGVWENYNREMYIKFAVDAGNAYVMAGGLPSQYTFSYDPYSVDADGDNVLTLSREAFNRLSLLDPKPLTWFRRKLEFMAKSGAIGNDSGQPVYGFVGDLDDIDDMIAKNDDYRERYLYAEPSLLVQGYGKVRKIPGYALMGDMQTPRFAVKTITATVVTLRRIEPMLEVEDDTVTAGTAFKVNPEYLASEISMFCILVRNVMRRETPPAGPAAPGGGTYFGTVPGLMGEPAWINNKDNDKNLLGLTGFYLMVYEAFAKPLQHATQAIVGLYKRCPSFKIINCETNTDAAASSSTLVHIASTSAYTVDADNDNLATIVLTQPLDAEIGAEVTVVNDSDVEVSAIIADSSKAPTYVLAFADGERPAAADMDDVDHAGVKVA